jgi:hypothetical protein
VQHRQGNAADLGFDQGDGFAVVAGGGQSFKTNHVTRAQHAQDAFAAIGGGAYQFDHAFAQREHTQGGLAFGVQRHVWREHHVADTAASAVRGAFPGRVNLDGIMFSI